MKSFDHESEHRYISSVLIGIICCLGTIFNLLVIFIILVLKDYKKIAHWYVLNLAFADAMFLLMLPLYLIEHLKEEWHFGLPLCIAYSAAFYTNYYAGVFFLAAMSFDRYVAIVHPVSTLWGKFRSNEGCWVITVVVWILSLVASSLVLVNVKVDKVCGIEFSTAGDDRDCIYAGVPKEHCEAHKNATQWHDRNLEEIFHEASGFSEMENMGGEEFYDLIGEAFASGEEKYETSVGPPSCTHPRFPLYVAWIYGNFVLTFLIPVATMMICYGCILRRLLKPRIRSSGSYKYRVKRPDGKHASAVTSRRRNNRITVLVISLVALFTVCWLPFHVTNMSRIRKGGIPWEGQSCRRLHEAVMLLAFSNSLFNPVLYTFFGANFDRRLRDVRRRIARRNMATKEFLASIKYAHKLDQGTYRHTGSTSIKTTKTTDSSVPRTHSDERYQLTSREHSNTSRHEEEYV